MSMDPMSAAHHHLASEGTSPHGSSSPHRHHPHPSLAYADPTAGVSGLGIETANAHHEYNLPVHHGHPQGVANSVRGTMGDERVPRSVPHGLTLAIPGQQQQWGATGPNSAPAGSGGMQLPPGYGSDQGHGGYY